MKEEFIIIFSWGVSQNSFCNSNKLLYFFILDRFKMQREMTTCQINFSCGIFPIRVTQRKVRRLVCYGQCIYRYCTGGWLQQADDKLSIEKKTKQNNQITKKKKPTTQQKQPHTKKIASLALHFVFFLSILHFFCPLLKMLFSFLAYLFSRLWSFLIFLPILDSLNNGN